MTSTQLPQQPDQNDGELEERIPTSTAPVLPARQGAADDEPLYLFDGEEDEQEPDLLETQYAAAPFQLSNAMPTLQTGTSNGVGQSFSASLPPQPRQKKSRKLPLLLIVGLSTVVVVLILTLAMTVFAAQGTPRSSTTPVATQQPVTQPKATQPPKKPTAMPKPQATPVSGGQNTQSTTWTAGQLPDGWLNAGLIKPDAVQAQYTGLTFAEREMELDFRNVGTRTAHGGTFTAATFILTPAAQNRFAQNDVRAINNVLFDRVAQQKLIQVAVDATPTLVKFQAQGNQRFAWIDVAFHLWQSRIDPGNAKLRIEGLDIDQGTKQPNIHHMTVLLLRVDPGNQGPDAPMGGTGWLVSNYGLDLPGNGLPDIVQPA